MYINWVENQKGDLRRIYVKILCAVAVWFAHRWRKLWNGKMDDSFRSFFVLYRINIDPFFDCSINSLDLLFRKYLTKCLVILTHHTDVRLPKFTNFGFSQSENKLFSRSYVEFCSDQFRMATGKNQAVVVYYFRNAGETLIRSESWLNVMSTHAHIVHLTHTVRFN